MAYGHPGRACLAGRCQALSRCCNRPSVLKPHGADGAALSNVKISSLGAANSPFAEMSRSREHGAFMSVTLSGLAVGENTIRIRIASSNVEKTYTVVVTRET